MINYWVMKTEPETFSIDDLATMPNQTDHWDGIRNYQARNMIRDDMKKTDQVFLYHSNCKNIGIVGIAKIVKEAYVDHTAFDPKSNYFDKKSDPKQPRWFMVDVKLVRKLNKIILLQDLKLEKRLQGMRLLARGNRLSISSVSSDHWEHILTME